MARKAPKGTYTVDDLSDSIKAEFTEVLLSLDSSFRTSYLLEECFSKFTRLDPEGAQKRKSSAIELWLRTEDRNRRTNIRLYSDSTSFRTSKGSISSDAILDFARREIKRIIGDELPEDILFGMYSGGASSSLPRRSGRPAKKFVDGAHVTADAAPYLNRLLEEVPIWGEIRAFDSYRVVRGNVMFTVPKNSDIDRVACKEPDVNTFLQKSVGDYFRLRLRRRAGINLNDQSINQGLAQRAVAEDLCTVDLSAASDSVTRALVHILLPTEWATYLDDIRSKETLIGEEWHENEMFSSMGNGFTFELESLLFYSLARSVAYHGGFKGRISVYGDDIIIPNKAFKLLKAVFGFVGLIVNSDKSHFSPSLFRESCGGHYYDGLCVKPFYVKEPISSIPRLIHFLNNLRRWSIGHKGDGTALYLFWKKLSKLVPERFHGGQDMSDIGSLVTPRKPWSERKLCPYLRKGYYKLVPLSVEESEPAASAAGAYLAWLNASHSRSDPLSIPGLITLERLIEEQLRDPTVTSTYTRSVRGRFRPVRNRGELLDVPEIWLDELAHST